MPFANGLKSSARRWNRVEAAFAVPALKNGVFLGGDGV